MARIKGTGKKKPLLIMGHTDVVGVQREKWTVDPFAAVNKNGVIYARGARDDKPHVVAGMMILLLLKRMNIQLDRDVIFLAEAGEEGTSTFGIDYMVKEHWPEIEAEYAIAEGGSIVEENGKPHHILISNTEKSPQRIRLVAHGPAGHGSRPEMANAVVHLAEAVAARRQVADPDAAERDHARLFRAPGGDFAAPIGGALSRHPEPRAARPKWTATSAEYEPGHYSILRTSVVPTIINIGFRSNVIPSEGEAMLDVRALPDEDMTKFVAELRRVIDDPSIEVIPPKTNARPGVAALAASIPICSASSKRSGDRMFNVPTLPNMMTGATDNAQLRAKGVQAYGIGPIVTPEEGPLGGAHTR